MAFSGSCLFGCGGLRNVWAISCSSNLFKLGVRWLDRGVLGATSLKFLSSRAEVEFNGSKKLSERFPCGIKLDLFDGTTAKRSNLQVNNQKQSAPDFCSLAKLTTVIVFDLETTGFGKTDRIIEFAARDLHGGRNSTFQSLVNPERRVLNSFIHNISTQMVNRPEVPTWKDLIPIVMLFIQSRQKTGGPVLWVAHNGRRFDFPFLIREFERCSVQIPEDWFFVDTVPLARELMKQEGSKLTSYSQEDLRKYFEIDKLGEAHRAMADVDTLARILQKLTFELKLPVSDLLEKACKASDLVKS